MRMSQLFVQTLRDVPTQAATPGYQLLLRAGFLYPLAAGTYSFQPLGAQLRRKIKAIARQAIQGIGGQEVALPLVQPADLFPGMDDRPQGYKPAGLLMGGPAVSFRDRSQRVVVLSTGHEEAILTVARNVIQSYRQLPVLLYHIWQLFRDESRTFSGLLGAREMLVVDGYSLHQDQSSLDDIYPQVRDAFDRVFDQCGLTVLHVAAAQEGDTVTFQKLVWPSALGEEQIVRCHTCGYTADQSIARTSKTPPPAEEMLPMEDVETPDCKTIADLARFLGIPKSRTAKALFLVAYIQGEGDRFVFAVVRGDTDLNEAKLKRVLGAETIGPATEAEIRSVGAEPGYGSPVGLASRGVTIVVDDLIPQSLNLVAGANRPGYHTRNVNYGRDYQAALVADITLAQKDDPCPECGTMLRLETGVEVAAMTRMGDTCSRVMDATYLDPASQAQPMVMGRYRLHLDRLLSAMAEVHHDEHGFTWPPAVAPYHVYLMTLGKRSETVDIVADRLYAELAAAGVDVLYDERDERAGVKFNDADLLGMPIRVVVGERGLQNGMVELKRRQESQVEAVLVDDLTRKVLSLL